MLKVLIKESDLEKFEQTIYDIDKVLLKDDNKEERYRQALLNVRERIAYLFDAMEVE